jgi:hypothetical protein
MPRMQPPVRVRKPFFGGLVGYPLDQLLEEAAFVSYHFHWAHEEVMALEHRDRRDWIAQISSINRRMNEERE